MATFTDKFTLAKPDEEDYYSIEDFNSNMDIIDEQLGEFDEKIEDIDTSINTLNTRMNDIDNSVGSSNDSIGNVQDSVDDITSDISNLKSTVDTIDSNTASTKTAVTTINTNTASTKTAVDTINTNTASTKTAVDTINTNTASTKTTVGTINTNTASTKTTVDTINTNTASTKTTVNSVDSKVDIIDTNIDSIKSTVTSLNSYLNSSSGNGLLGDIQNSSGGKYCKASNNWIVETYDLDLTSEVTSSGSYQLIKLFDYVSEYTGTIRLYLNVSYDLYSSSANTYVYWYDKTNKTYQDKPFFTPFSLIIPSALNPPDSKTYTLNTNNITSYNNYMIALDVPVLAGQSSLFVFYYTAMSKLVINQATIGFDICNAN